MAHRLAPISVFVLSLKLFTPSSSLALQLWGTPGVVSVTSRLYLNTILVLNTQHVSTSKATYICLSVAHSAVIYETPIHLKMFRPCMMVLKEVRVKALSGLPLSTTGSVAPGYQMLRSID